MAIAIAFTATISAQKLQYGIEAGLDLNKLSVPSSYQEAITNAKSTDNQLGYFVGPKIKFLTLIGLGFDAAVLYNWKKSTFENTSIENINGIDYNVTRSKTKNMNYLVVPINLRYQFNLLGSKLGIYATAGPQWSLFIGDRDLSWNSITNGALEETASATFKQNTISANLGAGIMLLSHLQVGFTYNFPLTDNGEMTFKYDNVNSVKENFKNNTWQIRLNYYF